MIQLGLPKKNMIVLIIFLPHVFISSVMASEASVINNSNSTQLKIDDISPTVQSNAQFVIYTFPILIIVGTLCNILTFLVMRRKKLRNQSTGFYMAVLAIADELALLVGCLTQWLFSYKNFNILSVSAYACKIFSVVLYTTFDFSVWMVVIMTIERFIAVTFPLKSMYFCTVKKAKIATLILTLILFAINSHFLFTHSYISRRNESWSGCQSKNETFDYFLENLWPWIDASKYAFVPFLSILVFNALIVFNLVKAATSIKNLSSNHKLKINNNALTVNTPNKHNSNPNNNNNNSNNSSQGNQNNNRKLTIMLLVVSITFCILSTPVVVLQVLERANPGSNSPIFYSICLLLQYVNHSTNFFLYVISGKLFRAEFIELMCSMMICFKRVSKNVNSNSNYKNTRTGTCSNMRSLSISSNYSKTNGLYMASKSFNNSKNNMLGSKQSFDLKKNNNETELMIMSGK